MTAQERPTFRVGDLVEVHIARAVVHNVLESSMMLRVGDVYLAVPLEPSPVVQVRRLAPVEWPPVLGDLWRDSVADLWFATLRAARVGDDGHVFESARLVMAPTRETPHLYREQRISPEALLDQYGPLELVHREPAARRPGRRRVMAADILAGIATGLREAAGEVAGLALVVAVVAVLAWYGRRQEVRRADERRARAQARCRPPALDPAECGTAVDPWPDADDDPEVSRLDRWDVLLPAGVW